MNPYRPDLNRAWDLWHETFIGDHVGSRVLAAIEKGAETRTRLGFNHCLSYPLSAR